MTAQDLQVIRDAASVLDIEGASDLAADLNQIGDKLTDQLKAEIDTPKVTVMTIKVANPKDAQYMLDELRGYEEYGEFRDGIEVQVDW